MDDSSTSTSSQSTEEEAQPRKHPNSKEMDLSSLNSSDSSDEDVQPDRHHNSKEMDFSSLNSSDSSDEDAQSDKHHNSKEMDFSSLNSSDSSDEDAQSDKHHNSKEMDISSLNSSDYSDENAQPEKHRNSKTTDESTSSASSQSSEEPETKKDRPGGSKSKYKEKPLETVTLKESSLLKAIELIRNKNNDVKTSPLDYFCPERKVRIKSLCCRNAGTKLRHRSRTAIPTNLQLLLYHLHKSIYRHEWPSAARCVVYLLKMNGKLLPVIYKSVILILLCHPGATKQHLTDFCQMLLGLRTKLEQEHFIEEILTLPDALPKCKMPKTYENLESEDVEVDEDNPLNAILEQLF